jgi:hypothetical protein
MTSGLQIKRFYEGDPLGLPKCQFVAAIETFSDKMKDGSFLDLDAHRTIKQSDLAKL